MNSGCGYELFWRLNPHKLEPFFESRKLKIQEQSVSQDNFAWLSGMYVAEAIASCFNRGSHYPQKPHGVNRDVDSGGKQLTDVEKFRLFAIKSNKIKKRKETGG